MKKRRSIAITFMALLIATLAFIFVSCKKSPDTIGNNLISGNNHIVPFHTDTMEILCHSFIDSVATKNATSALLGAMKDPVFGTTEAGIYTQFRPSVAGHSYGSNPVFDSIVLQLHLAGYYGDTTTLLTVHAHQLDDTLSSNSTYYNNTLLSTFNVDLAGSYQTRIHPKTRRHIIGTDTIVQPIVRIPLNAELGNYLMSLDTTVYSRPDLFKNAFHGLHISCSPVSANGVIAYINLTNNTYSLLQLYYHNADMPEKPMRYNFYVTSSDTYFNHFDHDYTQGSTDFVNQVLNGQEAMGQEVLYLQTMGGVKANLLFPNLSRWGDSLEGRHLVINEAKLMLPALPMSVDSIYTAPNSCVLVGYNPDSTTYILPDYYEGSGFFGGTYDAKQQNVSFRITEYMQSILLGKKQNLGLCLSINGASYNAYRFIINGPASNNEDKMRLEVTYSIVEE